MKIQHSFDLVPNTRRTSAGTRAMPGSHHALAFDAMACKSASAVDRSHAVSHDKNVVASPRILEFGASNPLHDKLVIEPDILWCDQSGSDWHWLAVRGGHGSMRLEEMPIVVVQTPRIISSGGLARCWRDAFCPSAEDADILLTESIQGDRHADDAQYAPDPSTPSTVTSTPPGRLPRALMKLTERVRGATAR